MHPYMTRALAAQQIREWRHEAEVARLAEKASRSRRSGRRLARRATTSGPCAG